MTKKKTKMFKPIQFVGYKAKDDPEVINLVNDLAREMRGLKPKIALKNYLLMTLPREVARLQKINRRLAV